MTAKLAGHPHTQGYIKLRFASPLCLVFAFPLSFLLSFFFFSFSYGYTSSTFGSFFVLRFGGWVFGFSFFRCYRWVVARSVFLCSRFRFRGCWLCAWFRFCLSGCFPACACLLCFFFRSWRWFVCSSVCCSCRRLFLRS